jgi:cellulose synthase/poly-beta-1,6-N-acetylglucosamine synthase-like glycosyltransferase
MNLDGMWIGAFFVLTALWAVVLISTITSEGRNVLVDRDVNLTIVTLIPVAITLVYFFLWIFIYSVYLLTFSKVKNRQISAQKMYSKTRHYGRPLCSIIAPARNETQYDDRELCSIIVPARNEVSVIRRTVLSCLNQSYQNIEVLVIAHNSDDGTYEEVRKLSDPRVRAFDFKTKATGKGLALNYGVEQARGKYILIVDADGIVMKDFIENAMPLFSDGHYIAVQGRFISSNRNYNLLTKMLSFEDDLWSSAFMTVRSFFGGRCPLAGTGFIIKKDALIEVGGFGSSLVDDYELSFRLSRQKRKLTYAPLSVIYDEKPPSLNIMFRQRARWAKGFISLLNQRIAEPADMVGHLIWLTPIATMMGLFMLVLIGYASIHNFLFEYYPFTFSYLPMDVWLLTVVVLYSLEVVVIVKQYGSKGLRNAAYLPIYLLFSQYSLIVTVKGFFVKSWGNTKTTHGFAVETDMQEILSEMKQTISK